MSFQFFSAKTVRAIMHLGLKQAGKAFVHFSPTLQSCYFMYVHTYEVARGPKKHLCTF